MRRFAFVAAAALAAVLLFPAVASANVTLDVGVLWKPDPDNDAQVFLHATNVAYPIPRAQVTPVFHQIRNPFDDYPVLAFIAHHAHVDIGTVWTFRSRQHSWFHVMLHFGVQPGALFVELPQPPGPPYGKAYGHWRKHGNRMKPRMVSDKDVRFWVRTRTAARYAKVSPARAWGWHLEGKHYEEVTGARYRKNHPPGKVKAASSNGDHDHGKGHSKQHKDKEHHPHN